MPFLRRGVGAAISCGGSGAGAHSRVGALGIWDIFMHDEHVGWRASLRLAVCCAWILEVHCRDAAGIRANIVCACL